MTTDFPITLEFKSHYLADLVEQLQLWIRDETAALPGD